jgi:hypothetical protein
MMLLAPPAAGASAFTPAEVRPSAPLLGTHTQVPTQLWDGLIDRLLALRVLEDDWDGQGASAPDPGVIQFALRLAVQFRGAGKPPADRVLAGVNGTVFFEWHTPAAYTEIEVVAPGRAEGRRVNNENNSVEEFAV